MSAMESRKAVPSRRGARIVGGITSVVNVLAGLVLLTTLGLRGFSGSAGEDTLLAQMVVVVSIVMLASGALAAVVAIRPNPRVAALTGSLVIATGIALLLFTIFQIGLPNIVLGSALLIVRRRM